MIKKNLKKIMIIILILLLISISLGIGAYAAYVLNATEVQYTKLGGGTVSVKEALDELYAKNRFQTSQIPLFFGDTIEVGGETFFVVQYSSKNENHVSAISARPLLYDSSSGKYRQVTGRERAGKWSFGDVAYWSSVCSEADIQFDINGIKGYGENTVMGVLESYADSLGALDFGLPGLGDLYLVLDSIFSSNTRLAGATVASYSHMLASDPTNCTCFSNKCGCDVSGSVSASDYWCETWDYEAADFDTLGEVNGVFHVADQVSMSSAFPVRPVLTFRKSEVSVVSRVSRNAVGR